MITRRHMLMASLATMLPGLAKAASCPPAPDIKGKGPWYNSGPLSLDQLKGKVVLVEFWTFGCYNCRNVMPYVNQWHDRHASQGLVVIGVHTPEFAHEADPRLVKNFIEVNGIEHPVVLDNDYAIWNRWGNRYWPAMYLLNKSGEMCYRHIGEGHYAETEAAIRQLLAES